MTDKKHYRELTAAEIRSLSAQGCICDDWSRISVAGDIDLSCIRRVSFSGRVRMDNPREGVGDRDCGIVDASVHNCNIGAGIRIRGVRNRIADYDIGDGVCIEDVGLIDASGDSRFGNGVEVSVLNEGGGREVPIVNELDAQIAYLVCLHRYRPPVIDKLRSRLLELADSRQRDRGHIERGASIRGVQRMRDIHVGEFAIVDGPAKLTNGTILSHREAVTEVGAGVNCADFILAEGAAVTDGAQLTATFVGQGSRIGKQFSAEHTLLFANCEAFHGEAVAAFAGPYTVTHHKSSLLIAGLFSFYNAGSGTNQSNHLYKLGPVHEGKLLRGCKTGSLSYIMWPARIGAFSVVLGKHSGNLDTEAFPFSHIEAAPDGKSYMIPGFNLATVGTVRDGAKWPKRDRRSAHSRRDRIVFDVLSPYTVSAMIRGRNMLAEKKKTVKRSVDSIMIGGLNVKRVLLHTGIRLFETGIRYYLLERVFSDMETQIAKGAKPTGVEPEQENVAPFRWADLAGQLVPVHTVDRLEDALSSGKMSSINEVKSFLEDAFDSYREEERTWVHAAFAANMEDDLLGPGVATAIRIAEAYEAAAVRFFGLIRTDAKREFDKPVMTGFGMDAPEERVQDDFAAVRGTAGNNAFIQEMEQRAEGISRRVAAFKKKVAENTPK